jgi:hypothetical protein
LGRTRCSVPDSLRIANYLLLLEENCALLNSMPLYYEGSLESITRLQQVQIKHLQLKNARLTECHKVELEELLSSPLKQQTTWITKNDGVQSDGAEHGYVFVPGYRRVEAQVRPRGICGEATPTQFDLESFSEGLKPLSTADQEAPRCPEPVPEPTLSACTHCQRTFTAAALARHSNICQRVFCGKRPTFMARRRAIRSLNRKHGVSNSSPVAHSKPPVRSQPIECAYCKRMFTTASLKYHLETCERWFAKKMARTACTPGCFRTVGAPNMKKKRIHRAPPEQCAHCPRTFATDSFACHARVCTRMFGAKREVFHAREAFLRGLYYKYDIIPQKAVRLGWDFRLRRAALLEGVRARRQDEMHRGFRDGPLAHWPTREAGPVTAAEGEPALGHISDICATVLRPRLPPGKRLIDMSGDELTAALKLPRAPAASHGGRSVPIHANGDFSGWFLEIAAAPTQALSEGAPAHADATAAPVTCVAETSGGAGCCSVQAPEATLTHTEPAAAVCSAEARLPNNNIAGDSPAAVVDPTCDESDAASRAYDEFGAASYAYDAGLLAHLAVEERHGATNNPPWHEACRLTVAVPPASISTASPLKNLLSVSCAEGRSGPFSAPSQSGPAGVDSPLSTSTIAPRNSELVPPAPHSPAPVVCSFVAHDPRYEEIVNAYSSGAPTTCACTRCDPTGRYTTNARSPTESCPHAALEASVNGPVAACSAAQAAPSTTCTCHRCSPLGRSAPCPTPCQSASAPTTAPTGPVSCKAEFCITGYDDAHGAAATLRNIEAIFAYESCPRPKTKRRVVLPSMKVSTTKSPAGLAPPRCPRNGYHVNIGDKTREVVVDNVLAPAVNPTAPATTWTDDAQAAAAAPIHEESTAAIALGGNSALDHVADDGPAVAAELTAEEREVVIRTRFDALKVEYSHVAEICASCPLPADYELLRAEVFLGRLRVDAAIAQAVATKRGVV